MGIKAMIGGVKMFAEFVGKGKRALEAVDDDIDGDGIAQTKQIETKYHNIFDLIFAKLFPEIKDFFALIAGLFGHVANEAANKKED